MFHIKSSFILIFVAFYIELSVFEDFLANAKSSHRNEFEEDLEMSRAVRESMKQWRSRKSHSSRHKRETNVVCYGDLGCFEDNGPFGYIDTLPSPPEEIDTKFFVYNSKNRSDNPFLQFAFHDISKYSLLNETIAASKINTTSRNARMDKNAPKNSTFDPSKIYKKFGNLSEASMRVIVHGFGSSCPHEWITEMRNALMAVEECYVMCIDWEKGSALPNYVRAAANTRLIGKQLAFLLKKLNKHNGLDFNRTHIIGFSLGAHASGFAGAEIKKIRRITGLDPAGPLFEGAHVAARLDESDAEFVDVIHSNGENLILGGLGSWQPMGHVDFYPNGGKIQHGCQNLFLGAVTDIAGIWNSASKAEGRSLCNHRRAYKFFIDSVAPRCLFPAFPCDSYENFLQGKCFHCPNRKPKAIRSDSVVQDLQIHNRVDSICGSMGYYADKSTGRGQLYLRTRDEEPFCAHQYNLKLYSSTNDLPIRTLGRIDVELESDGGLVEAFTLTERDDQELFVGDFISKIIVPHPALNFPRKIAVTYQVYRGWLTRGLSSWSINKVILSDSFGESYSLCKNFILESGKAQHMTLEPGDCHEEELLRLAETSTTTPSTTTTTLSSKETIEVSNRHIPLHRNASSSSLKGEVKLWKPIVKSRPKNITSTSSVETNEAVPTIELNLGEVLLEPKNKSGGIKNGNEKRSFSNGSSDDNNNFAVKNTQLTAAALINEPPKREDSMDHEEQQQQQQLRERRGGEQITSTTTNSEDSSDENKFVTVQLFQYRLGDVFERAEKYARNTLFPLLSEQISSIFNFESAEGDGGDESTDSPIVIKQNNKKYDEVPKIDLKSLETMGIQVKSEPIEKVQRKRNFDPKPSDYIFDQTPEASDLDVAAVYVDLPTYRPNTMFKHFIPLLRNAEDE